VTPSLWAYVAAWSSFTIIAGLVAFRHVRLAWRDALAFLLVPWKVAVFVPAILFVTFAGCFTDDETWDVVSGGGMSILTVLTAWWSVGTAVRVVRRMRPARELFVAIAVTLFSASWFYDGYLLLRDGAYTARWLGNLMLSPTIYLCAGLLSNLEIDAAGRLGFSFLRAEWPRPLPNARRVNAAMVLVSLPLIAIAAWFLVGFVGWHGPAANAAPAR
jgi:hypothetical protein